MNKKSKKTKGQKQADPEPELLREELLQERLKYKKFPGPQDAVAPLRVYLSRSVSSEVYNHAQSDLENEIAGVLVGEAFADEQGAFVMVDAIVKADQTDKGATHVTFTQDTWIAIHAIMEKQYPKKHIVGWYHSHPGFGVQFSDMDLFIHQNFFPSPTQVALVIDPSKGQTAICFNDAGSTRYLDRYWVEGREQGLQVPEHESPANSDTQDGETSSASVQNLERRILQLTQMTEQMQVRVSNYLFTLIVSILLMIAGFFGYMVYESFSQRTRPPELQSMLPVPIQVGDKTVMLGVGVYNWDVPDELNAILVQAQLERWAQEEALKQASEAKASNEAPGEQSSEAPPPSEPASTES